MLIPPVTASNPYQDFATANGLDYGNVLHYVGILDGEEPTSFWQQKALIELDISHMKAIEDFRLRLRKHYKLEN